MTARNIIEILVDLYLQVDILELGVYVCMKTLDEKKNQITLRPQYKFCFHRNYRIRLFCCIHAFKSCNSFKLYLENMSSNLFCSAFFQKLNLVGITNV